MPYAKKGPFQIRCRCGAGFLSPVPNAKQCPDCRGQHKTKLPNEHGVSLSSGTVGALHELLVAADLLRRGYAVFRALSQSAPCDLAILLGPRLFRVEVTTGYRNASGYVSSPKRKHEREKWDVLAIVLHDGEILYEGLPQ